MRQIGALQSNVLSHVPSQTRNQEHFIKQGKSENKRLKIIKKQKVDSTRSCVMLRGNLFNPQGESLRASDRQTVPAVLITADVQEQRKRPSFVQESTVRFANNVDGEGF